MRSIEGDGEADVPDPGFGIDWLTIALMAATAVMFAVGVVSLVLGRLA